jgi:hypothetical protein
MNTLPKFRDYSVDLWHYLPDMESYMPPVEDRELVLRRSAVPGQEHRVRIWDYFFRPQPEDVGKPVRNEMAQLEADISRHTDEASQALQAIREKVSNLEQTRDRERRQIEADLLEKEKVILAAEKKEGNWLVASGSALAAASLLAAGYLVMEGAKNLWILYAIAGLPMLVFGAIRLAGGLGQLASENLANKVAQAQGSLRTRLEDLESRTREALASAYAESVDPEWLLDRLVPHLRSRLASLQSLLQSLLDQLPRPPMAEEVEYWLWQDLGLQIDEGAAHFGVHKEQLDYEYDGYNPIILLGPAELQGASEIPDICFKGERNRYLMARRVGRFAGGKRFQHYGIYCAELLYITGSTLGRFSVYFDFIRGYALRERAPLQHYADFVILEMRKEYREVDFWGRKIELFRFPSLHLSLKSSDRIIITLPSDEYFEAAGLTNFRPLQSDYDASRTADKAMRAIRQKVDQAKKNLEVSELVRQEQRRQDSKLG